MAECGAPVQREALSTAAIDWSWVMHFYADNVFLDERASKLVAYLFAWKEAAASLGLPHLWQTIEPAVNLMPQKQVWASHMCQSQSQRTAT